MIKLIFEYLKEKWYKFLGHLATIIMMIIKVCNTDYGISANITIDIMLSVSIAVSVAFTINIAVDYKKNVFTVLQEAETINNYNIRIESLESIKKNYETQLNNYSAKESHIIENNNNPYLAIKPIPYRIKGNLFGIKHEEDYIEFIDDSIQEISGKTYYCYVNGKDVNFSLEKERIIKEYFHDTMDTKRLQNGIALVNKPRHLIVFKLINVGAEAATSLFPIVNYDNNENTYKGIQPTIINRNEELLFIVLVELQGQSTIKYDFVFEYYHKGKHLKQSFPVNLANQNLEFITELSEPVVVHTQ